MSDPLLPNELDDTRLVFEVNKAVIETEQLYMKTHQMSLEVPADLAADFLLYRAALDRQSNQDYRSSISERKAVKHIAQWILNIYQKLRGQECTRILWKESIGL